MRIITYAYDRDDGLVYSRVGSEIALPVLDYEGMTPSNGWAMMYNLEAFSIYAIGRGWSRLKWTKKIPTALKNKHREFWGFKPLREGTDVRDSS